MVISLHVIAWMGHSSTPPGPPTSAWILATGTWNDSGEWLDTSNWID